MNDSLGPYDPFEVGLSLDDPLHHVDEPLDAPLDAFPASPVPYDQTPEMFCPADSSGDLMGISESVKEPSDPVIDLDDYFEQSLSLNSADVFKPVPDTEPDMLDEVEDSILHELFPGRPVFSILDVLEDWIEEGKPSHCESSLETWPQLQGDNHGNEQQSENQSSQQFYGVSSPDPKIDRKPEYAQERQPKIRTWRPRRHSGIRSGSLDKKSIAGKSSSEKDTDSSETRKCPKTDEVVALAECENCEHFQDGECTWQSEEKGADETE
jgi:hypothetical protein